MMGLQIVFQTSIFALKFWFLPISIVKGKNILLQYIAIIAVTYK